MKRPSPIGNLAGQTAIYGLSTVGGRFLNYLLVVVHTKAFSPAEYGAISDLYAYVGFFIILFTYGLETAFFRFSQKHNGDARVYSTALRSVVVSSLLLVGLLVALATPISDALSYGGSPEYIIYLGAILGLDAIAAIPFAKLRAENRPALFAGIKLTNIAMNIGLNVTLLVIVPAVDPSFEADVSYVFIANLVASAVTLLLLLPQLRDIQRGFDYRLWKQMIKYAWPLIIVGLAGMINEVIDRPLLKYLLPGTVAENLAQVGIYSACYKLSILMTLFVQAYRYAAEPFFFSQAAKENAPQLYASVMKYFVIAGVFIFLVVTLFIDVFKYLIGEDYHEGLFIVPILLLANLFLGMYYNISIWYKLTDKTRIGAMISLFGAAITIALNIILIPEFGYEGAAWTTLAAYFGICVLGYIVGQRYYLIPYSLGRVAFYLALGATLFAAHGWIMSSSGLTGAPVWVLRFVLLAAFGVMAFLVETRSRGEAR